MYVYGDDFACKARVVQGPRGEIIGIKEMCQKIQDVLDAVGKANPPDKKGRRPVTIHTVGFPVLFQSQGALKGDELAELRSAYNFSLLMRKLAEQNGGTFIGLANTMDGY